jgi:uncharacterized repeat protein (TIGR02543 family)
VQGTALTLATNSGNLVKTGSTFAGWNTAANGSGTAYAVSASYTTEATVTLYAQWTALPVAPTITTQPLPQAVTVGQTARFTVVATGSPTPTYQWLKNGVVIAGATDAAYVTPATAMVDNGAKFSVVVTNSLNSVTSEEKTLTVSPAAQTITFAALASKTVGDSPFMLTATASSGLAVMYSSSDPAVATVDAAGLVTIVAAGTVDITASQAGNAQFAAAPSVTRTLTVTAAPVATPADPVAPAPLPATGNGGDCGAGGLGGLGLALLAGIVMSRRERRERRERV